MTYIESVKKSVRAVLSQRVVHRRHPEVLSRRRLEALHERGKRIHCAVFIACAFKGSKTLLQRALGLHHAAGLQQRKRVFDA